MKVYKFGGASVKDANGVKNLARIVADEPGELLIVVSAMGKITNLLETLCNAYFHRQAPVDPVFRQLQDYHWAIVRDLFPPDDDVYPRLNGLFAQIRDILRGEPSLSYDYEYDRLIPFGELLSTTIVSAYLNRLGIHNRWADIRRCLRTDDNYRDANVDLLLSGALVPAVFDFTASPCYLTQGFIAATPTNQTTTLGREGSDYTAALLANLLSATDVTIWKDVPGVMNADPREYPAIMHTPPRACPAPCVIPRMSYKEAIELSHFGAKVIHPKTIKPLQNKSIPLRVKSFLHPAEPGTLITAIDEPLSLPPILIHKPHQTLLTLTPRDFSFIAEEKLSQIFAILARHKMHLNLMQNSAISFSFCVDGGATFEAFLHDLQPAFEVLYNRDVSLFTVRHYTDAFLRDLIGDRVPLVEQRSRLTAQYVLAR